MKQNIKIFALASAMLPLLVACETKVVDSQYPAQKIYLPAASRGTVYTIESVDTHVGNTPTEGATFRFTIDWAESLFNIPMSVYRAGVNNIGGHTVNIYDDGALVEECISNGTLPAGTLRLDEVFYTLPSSVVLPDGKSSASFNLQCDLDYLMSMSPINKFAVGLRIGSSDVAVNEALSSIVILIDTKVFKDPNLPE